MFWGKDDEEREKRKRGEGEGETSSRMRGGRGLYCVCGFLLFSRAKESTS